VPNETPHGAIKSRQLLVQIEAERKKANQIRTGVTIGVLAMFGIFALVTYNRVKSFDDQALLEHLQEQATTTVWPLVAQQMDGVAKQAVPAITAAMQDELETLLPRLSDRLSQEAVTLQENLNKRMKISLDAAIASELDAHKDELQGALGDLHSDSALYDDLLRRLQETSRQWAMNQLDTTFADHIKVLQSINDSVVKLQAQVKGERAAGKRDEENIDDAMDLFLDILDSRISKDG